jgi:alpha-galactosidase
MATGVWSPPGPVRLPGLDPEAVYRVAPLPPGDLAEAPFHLAAPPWWGTGVALTGRMLATAGVQAPALLPDRLVLLSVDRAAAEGTIA